MQSSQWVNFLCSWTDGPRIVSLSIQISLLAVVNITTTTVTINFLFAKNLLKYVTFKLWNINSKLASLKCVTCHCWLAPFISLLKISILFQTVHLLLLPNWKNAVLHSVQNDINGCWIFFKHSLLYIISGSCIKCHFHLTCSKIPNFKIKLSLHSALSFSDPIRQPQSKAWLYLPQYTLCWLVRVSYFPHSSLQTHNFLWNT